MTGPGMGGMGTSNEGDNPYEVVIELCGIIYIYNPPNPEKLATGTGSEKTGENTTDAATGPAAVQPGQPGPTATQPTALGAQPAAAPTTPTPATACRRQACQRRACRRRACHRRAGPMPGAAAGRGARRRRATTRGTTRGARGGNADATVASDSLASGAQTEGGPSDESEAEVRQEGDFGFLRRQRREGPLRRRGPRFLVLRLSGGRPGTVRQDSGEPAHRGRKCHPAHRTVRRKSYQGDHRPWGCDREHQRPDQGRARTSS